MTILIVSYLVVFVDSTPRNLTIGDIIQVSNHLNKIQSLRKKDEMLQRLTELPYWATAADKLLQQNTPANPVHLK